MRVIKKSISIMLALALTLSLTSVTALADEGEITTWAQLKGAIDSAADGDTITLTQDITAGPDDELLIVSGKSITLNLNGCKLDRGRTSSDVNGHVIEVYSDGALCLYDSSFGGTVTGGWANNGGGICNYGTLEVEFVTISGNRSVSTGGGIVNHGMLTLTDVTIEDNITEGSGGGVWSDGPVIMNSGVFQRNKAANGSGGAILSRKSLSIASGEFKENSVTGAGGAIWSDGTAAISTATFENNTGAINGGAIANHGTMTLTNCYIANNSASAAGGAVFSGNNGNFEVNAKLTVRSGKIIENSAPLGGGIYVESDTVILEDTDVWDNTANEKGGGVYVSASLSDNILMNPDSKGKLEASGSSISYNTAANGGGIYITQQYMELGEDNGYRFCMGSADLTDSSVSENKASVDGGGIVNYGELMLSN